MLCYRFKATTTIITIDVNQVHKETINSFSNFEFKR